MAHPFKVEKELELEATPEEVWEAVATGPGLDAWFMGTNEIEPREGGVARMTLPAFSLESTITVWDPPHHLVLDTGAPAGDAMVRVADLETPVSPGSTVGGCLLVNSIKAEVALRLTRAGVPPKVLTAAAIIGSKQATALFESAYDEHARRLARLYERIGLPMEK